MFFTDSERQSEIPSQVSPCSRVICNPNFISQNFFHFFSFIHNEDNLSLQKNNEILWGNFENGYRDFGLCT